MSALALRRRVAVFGRARNRLRLSAISPEARWGWVAVIAFVAMSAWWLTQDTRVPDYDSGAHMYYALVTHGELSLGQLANPFTDWNTYPPLVHLIGGLSVLLTGAHPM